MKKAEEIAPAEEWKVRLAEDDIPSTREEVETEMDEAELKVITTIDCDFFCPMHQQSTQLDCTTFTGQFNHGQSSRHS